MKLDLQPVQWNLVSLALQSLQQQAAVALESIQLQAKAAQETAPAPEPSPEDGAA